MINLNKYVAFVTYQILNALMIIHEACILCSGLKGVGFPRYQVEQQNTPKTQLKIIGKYIGSIYNQENDSSYKSLLYLLYKCFFWASRGSSAHGMWSECQSLHLVHATLPLPHSGSLLFPL